MNRRAFLTFGMGMAASMLAGQRSALADLEPDGLYLIYRRYALQIVGQRDDEAASAFSGAVVDILARFLPQSRAQLARAADTRRVGVLIGTNLQDVAVMAGESAEALFLAKPPFADIRGVPLRVIAAFDKHVLVCRIDFPARHAFLLAQTLAGHEEMLPAPVRAPAGVIPAHPGSRAFFTGERMPA